MADERRRINGVKVTRSLWVGVEFRDGEHWVVVEVICLLNPELAHRDAYRPEAARELAESVFQQEQEPAVYRVGDVMSTYMYRKGLENMEYSTATAVGLFKNSISFAIVIASNHIAKRINDYGIW